MNIRRLLATIGLTSLIAGCLVSSGFAAAVPLKFKATFIQEATYRHPAPPDGNDGDTFSTTLKLKTEGAALNLPDRTPLGTMSFSWLYINAKNFSCGANAAGCKGKTDLNTITKLPGGTLTAGGKGISVEKGLIVPVTSGTGIFKGATGTITIAPKGAAEIMFDLKLAK